MMRILIAVGGSEHSQIALGQMVYLAQKWPAAVTILTVIKDESERMKGEAVLQDAVDFLQTAVPTLTNIQTKLRIGHAGEQIITEAVSIECELLIIGERPQHKLLTRLMGPTALRIIAQIACPVLIAKEQPHPLEQILICDSVYAEPTLSERFARHFPEIIAEVENVTVLHVMSQIAAAPGVPGQQLRADVDELMVAHSPEGDVLTHEVQVLRKIDVAAAPVVRHGLVVEEILAEAVDGRYDLVVIGAHPHEGWQRFLLEDVTAQIVHHADRPVLVIP